jgi:redox-sensitive bicupin YhaK (pirin superfamily)
MIIVRKSEERRHIQAKNQKTWMTFDWENTADPLQNGFGVLKILNEEMLSPGSGFILHTHRDMVVVTYISEGMLIYKGPLEHPDSLEAKEFYSAHVAPGAKQYAINVSPTEDTHVFQSGFTPGDGHPERTGVKKLFTYAERNGILKLIASPDGREASLPLRQDVQIYSTFIHRGNHMIHELGPGRSAWLHVVKGQISLNDFRLHTGDGAGLSGEMAVSFTAREPTEILLFDLGGQIPEETKTSPESRLAVVAV